MPHEMRKGSEQRWRTLAIRESGIHFHAAEQVFDDFSCRREATPFLRALKRFLS